MKKYFILLSLFAFIGACSQPQKSTPMSLSVNKKSAPNTENLQYRFSQLKRGYSDVIRITQFGDSHSAADFFTGRLRNVLQSRYGDAGIGWVSPVHIRGQRHEKITYDTEGWQLLDSRRDDYPDYPMGGFVAKAETDDAVIQVNSRTDNNDNWLIKLLIRNSSYSEWQAVQRSTNLPAHISTPQQGVEIGGIWLTKVPAKGVIFETIAANGAQNTLWNKWEKSWLQRELATLSRSDMVILSYGTNEAFYDRLNLQKFRQEMTHRVQQIRQTLPQALILIIGAPESYRAKASKQQSSTELSLDCENKRPLLLGQVQQILSDIANEQGTLYWDWQQAMGGQCQVPQLINDKLMQKDGIHFTAKGYKYAADRLIEYLESIGLISIN